MTSAERKFITYMSSGLKYEPRILKILVPLTFAVVQWERGGIKQFYSPYDTLSSVGCEEQGIACFFFHPVNRDSPVAWERIKL